MTNEQKIKSVSEMKVLIKTIQHNNLLYDVFSNYIVSF